MSLQRSVPVIAIIGGGFSGAAVAFHLASNSVFNGCPIVVFEPRPSLGSGLAYDTSDLAHRINVPATRMSLLPDDDAHFARWLADHGEPRDDPQALTADGQLFPRRALFGRYVESSLACALASGRIRHVSQRVVGMARQGERWRVTDAEGGTMVADIVVIATTHPPPEPPADIDRALSGHPRYIADATVPKALAVVRPHDRVLVVGTGLTSADVIASLKARGHVGPVTALSRRGLRSRGHAVAPQDPFGEFLVPPHDTARALLRAVRRTIREAAHREISWHAVFDGLRAQASGIWRGLPLAEKRRLVRHLRSYWDAHRFRIAPQVEDILDQSIANGLLQIVAGRIVGIEHQGDVIACTIRSRRSTIEERKLFDAVVVTTGPSHRGVMNSQPWLRELAAHGFVSMDPVGLGLACNDRSQALGAGGVTTDGLFIAGPLARGTFGELMGLPQVSQHARLVAEWIAGAVR
jgi:uncharacterized NAD(P)/FAD-binding protein YdhS